LLGCEDPFCGRPSALAAPRKLPFVHVGCTQRSFREVPTGSREVPIASLRRPLLSQLTEHQLGHSPSDYHLRLGSMSLEWLA
jgi:hypothetical protein